MLLMSNCDKFKLAMTDLFINEGYGIKRNP